MMHEEKNITLKSSTKIAYLLLKYNRQRSYGKYINLLLLNIESGLEKEKNVIK